MNVIQRLRNKRKGVAGATSEPYDPYVVDGEECVDPDVDRNVRSHARFDPYEEEEEEPEDHAINLLGDGTQASDASTAIKALLGEGGDNRASSQLEDDQLVAIFDLLDVGAEMGSERLLKNAEDFLILRISAKGGTGRQQIVSAFRGLYEPQSGGINDPNGQPTGTLRGRP